MSKKTSKSPGACGSADIRSFFRPKSQQQSSSSQNDNVKEAEKSTKRKAVVLSDSDEDNDANTKKLINNGSQKLSSSPKSKLIKISTVSSSSKKRSGIAVDLFADDDEESTKKPNKDDTEKVEKKKSSASSSSKPSSQSSSSSKGISSPSKSSPVKTNGHHSKTPEKKEKTSKDNDSSPSKSRSSSRKVDSEKPVKEVKREKEEEKKESSKKDSPSKRKTSSTVEKDTATKTTTKEKIKKEEESPKSTPEKSKSKRSASVIKSYSSDDEEESPRKKRKAHESTDESKSVKKEKKPKTSDSSVSSDSKTPKSDLTEEEKKQKRSSSYFKYMSRGPPKELGTKELPEGCPNCLEDMTFVITGVLPAFEKEDVVAKIVELGGKVTSAPSGKTTYLIVGDDPGESKLDKANKLGIKKLTQDEFLDLLKYYEENGPPPKNPKKEDDEKSKKKKSKASKEKKDTSSSSRSTRNDDDEEGDDDNSRSKSDVKKKKSKVDDSPSKKNISPVKSSSSFSAPSSSKIQTTKTTPIKSSSSSSPPLPPSSGDLMWVDKYKPTTLKNIVGQQSDNSNAKKLLRWLANWFKYHGSATDKAKASYPGLKDPEGKTFKVALLSGPPGVGKTTTAHLVCKELNYDYTELNASDKRNKKSFHETVQDKLGNLECMTYFSGNNNGKMNRKHVLIMDEVDGMSGNEDRGGIQELISLLKTSRIPIICICNDRNHPKIRSLANYCYDLRFNKPTNVQLKGFVQQICFKEKIKVPAEVLQQLIISTDQDVRQILHQLQMVKEIETKGESTSVYNPRKDLKLGPWEVCRKVFQASDHRNMTINDKASLFFHDYSLGPLFVQENYLRCDPIAANGDRFKTMDLVKAAAESLAIGDITESLVRKSNNWGLLPVQAIFQSVLPGEYMETQSMSGLDFPKWLGRNSNRNKRLRLLQQIHSHLHLEVSGSLEALNMEYLPYLRRAIVNPLVKEDVETAVNHMTTYCLLREDLDNISELALWPNMRDLWDKVDKKTKTAFTKQVNKDLFVPYSIAKVVNKRGKGGGAGGTDEELLDGLDEEGEGSESEDDDEEDDLKKDAMIKEKSSKGKAGESSKAKGKTAKSNDSKGKKGKK